MGNRFNPKQILERGPLLTRGGSVGFDTGIPLDRFREGELIVALHPEALRPPLVRGYSRAAIELLTMLWRDHRATAQTLWPVGVDVLQAGSGPAPMLPGAMTLPPEMFLREKLEGMDWLPPEVLQEARLLLLVKVNPAETVTVLGKVSSHAVVRYAEQVPRITVPEFSATPFPGSPQPTNPKEPKQQSTEPALTWPMTAVDPDGKLVRVSANNIAVLDSGADGSHAALKGSVIFGTAESSADTYGHGTFVCSVIVGKGGVKRTATGPALPAGVLAGSKVWTMKVIVPVAKGSKVHELHAGRYSLGLRVLALPSLPAAKTDPVKLTQRPSGIQVVNLSLWSGESIWKTEESQVKALADAGMVVVGASGNAGITRGSNSAVRHPAALTSCISVGAFTSAKMRWENTCSATPDTGRAPAVDVYAPGEKVFAALPMTSAAIGQTFGGGLTGTSMAAPYVTALAGLLKASNPLWKAGDVVAALKAKTTPTTDSGGAWYPLRW